MSRKDYPVHGTYSLGLAGYEVSIDPDGEHVHFRWTSMTGGKPYWQTAKVYHTAKGRAYFKASGRRIHLDQVLRVS